MKIKQQLLTILTLLVGIITYGQNYFSLNSNIGKKTVVINGKNYTIDSTYSKIETAYPKFDTLLFKNDGWEDDHKIYCNFKPDSSYTFILACCGSTDIVPSWKANHDSLKTWDFNKCKSLLMDKPHITLKITNGSSKDSIYGWYSDYSCIPHFKILDKKGWKYGVPVKCFYWNNISPFIFFKSKEDYSKSRKEDGVIENEYPEEDYQKLGLIYLRLFDNKNYTISYDVITKNTTLTYNN